MPFYVAGESDVDRLDCFLFTSSPHQTDEEKETQR
jgi:hypothetical protein